MKNKFIVGTLCLASLLGLSSCSDFLTEEPQGVLTPETFFTTQNDLDMAVYAMMAQIQNYQCNTNPCLIDCQGDDVTSTIGSNKAAYLSADGFSEPSDLKGINGTWNSMYAIIKAANEIIKYADKTNTTEQEIKIAKGQAYFWRAFSYFNLVRYYGPVILNLTNDSDNNSSPLSSVEDVYNQIVADLNEADSYNLPASYSGEPRNISGANAYITAQAVKSMLAAVHLHMAGWPLNKTEHYADAAKYAKQVIDGVNAHTYNQSVVPWNQVYNYGNNYNNGCIVGIYYSVAQMGWWSSSDSQWSSCHQSGKLWSGWGDFIPERLFWSTYPEGPRKDNVYAKQILLDDAFADKDENYIAVDWWATRDGQPIAADRNNEVVPLYQPMFVGYSVNKDASGSLIAQPFDCLLPTWGGMCLAKTHQLVRYSEVLCWYAEAVGRGGSNDVAGAREALKQVYQAAYDDPAKIASVATLSGEALAQAAFNEHGWEVAGNTLGMVTRRSDQLRMNLLKQAWEYRRSAQTTPLVPAGTLTHSARPVYKINDEGKEEIDYWEPFTYTTTAPVVIAENFGPNEVAASWQGDKSIYMIYPPTETAKNPNLVR